MSHARLPHRSKSSAGTLLGLRPCRKLITPNFHHRTRHTSSPCPRCQDTQLWNPGLKTQSNSVSEEGTSKCL